MQYIHEQPSRVYAWLTLALFAGFALILGVAIFMQPADKQVAQHEVPSPLPLEQVVPPITQPAQ